MWLSPIHLDGELFHPRDSLWRFGYWFMPTRSSSTHFLRRLLLAQAAFGLITWLSPPRVGLAPYLCHKLARSLIASILLYRADLFTPNTGFLSRLNTFRHKLQR